MWSRRSSTRTSAFVLHMTKAALKAVVSYYIAICIEAFQFRHQNRTDLYTNTVILEYCFIHGSICGVELGSKISLILVF